MRNVNLDELLKNIGFGPLIQAIKEEEKFKDFREESVVVHNITQGIDDPERPSLCLGERDTSLGIDNVASAFGEMGYKFLPSNHATKFYNCDQISFGKYTENVVRFFSDNLEDVEKGTLTFKIDLNSIPYKRYIKSVKFDYSELETRLMDKFCSKELIYHVSEKLDKTPSQAKEHIRSGIHSWVLVILTKYDLKDGMQIAEYFDFENRQYLDEDLKTQSKKYLVNKIEAAKERLKNELSKLDAKFVFESDNDSYPLFQDYIENEMIKFVLNERTERYKGVIELPKLEFDNRNFDRNRTETKYSKLHYNRNIIRVLKALISLL